MGAGNGPTSPEGWDCWLPAWLPELANLYVVRMNENSIVSARPEGVALVRYGGDPILQTRLCLWCTDATDSCSHGRTCLVTDSACGEMNTIYAADETEHALDALALGHILRFGASPAERTGVSMPSEGSGRLPGLRDDVPADSQPGIGEGCRTRPSPGAGWASAWRSAGSGACHRFARRGRADLVSGLTGRHAPHS